MHSGNFIPKTYRQLYYRKQPGKNRKIFAGTGSEAGRRAGDTFMSLQKICKKLVLSFRDYLIDRLAATNYIPDLTTPNENQDWPM
jgi:hypothetical protein